MRTGTPTKLWKVALTCRSLHKLVQLKENLFESLLVALRAEALQLDQLFLEVFLDPQGYLLAYKKLVRIEYDAR